MSLDTKDVKSSVLPQSVSGTTVTSLARLNDVASAIAHLRDKIVSSSSSSGLSFTDDETALLFSIFSAESPKGLGQGVKCLTRLAGNLLADNLAADAGFYLNLIAAGAGQNQRIGSSVRCIRCIFRWRGLARSISQAFASQEMPVFRTSLMWDKMPFLATQFAEIIAAGAPTTDYKAPFVAAGNAGLTEACPHPVTRHARYEEIVDKIDYPMTQVVSAGTAGTNSQTTAVAIHESDTDLKGRKTTFFDTTGGTSTQLEGGLAYWVVADADQDAVCALNYEYCCNVYYVDD